MEAARKRAVSDLAINAASSSSIDMELTRLQRLMVDAHTADKPFERCQELLACCNCLRMKLLAQAEVCVPRDLDDLMTSKSYIDMQYTTGAGLTKMNWQENPA